MLVMMGVVIVVAIGTTLLANQLRLPAILPLLGVGVLSAFPCATRASLSATRISPTSSPRSVNPASPSWPA
jgi:hypothetical protein